MRIPALISILLSLIFVCPDAKGQSFNYTPVTLSKYLVSNEDAQSGKITEIILPEETTVTLGGKDAKWLTLKDHSVFIKPKFAKATLKKKEINFTVRTKGQSGMDETHSFTLLSDQFKHNKVIAHRGAWKNTGSSQNSVASLKAAIALGCFGSETDVHMTADSAIVVNHDNEWGGFSVQKSALAELQKTKLSNGETLPVLEDFLKIIKQQRGTKLILEIKASVKGKQWADATVKRVVNIVQKMEAQAWITYISFDYGMLKEVLRLEPSANVQYLNGDKSPLELKKDGVKGADYYFTVFQKHPQWIQSAKENNIDINAWTVNESKDMDWLVANDVNFITTNEPELLFKQIEKSPVSRGMKLVWSDEFNYNGLPDSSKWNFDVGGHGWGNNEKQFYTDRDTMNAIVKNGVLSIIARKEKHDNNDYTSARLLTKGKAEWTYGHIEISGKLPPGRGLWPAGWMLGSDVETKGWPECGEIDIMEHVGYKKDSVFGTVHTGAYNHVKGTQRGTTTLIENPYSQFHTFAVDWTEEKMDFLLDGKLFYHFKNEHKTSAEWPFDRPFFILLNMAIGGNLGGQKGIDDSIFPATFEIDYVRVFQ